MKLLFSGIMLFVTVAFAGPGDLDQIQNIPVKSKLIFSKDLGILPGTYYTAIYEENIINNSAYTNFCEFEYPISQENRIIRAGRSLAVIGYSSRRGANGNIQIEDTVLELENSLSIRCVRVAIDRYPDRLTIGNLRSMLWRLGVELSIAPPADF